MFEDYDIVQPTNSVSILSVKLSTIFITKANYSIDCVGVKTDLPVWMTNPSELNISAILNIFSNHYLKLLLSVMRSSKYPASMVTAGASEV